MIEKKFDTNKLQKLNNPERLKDTPPDYIWDKLNPGKADVLVEIGAGTAFFSLAFMKQAKASKVFACDISDVMIKWVQENITPEYPNIIPVKTEEDSVHLEDEIADIVFMINLHHELHNPNQIVSESWRLLKPGGKVFIVDWKKESPTGPPIEIRCLPEQVKDQLEASGFKNVEYYNELPKHFLVIGEKDK